MNERNGYGDGSETSFMKRQVIEHEIHITSINQDRRDLWQAIGESRHAYAQLKDESAKESKRLEAMIQDIAKKVAQMNALFLIANGVMVALIVKYLSHGSIQ